MNDTVKKAFTLPPKCGPFGMVITHRDYTPSSPPLARTTPFVCFPPLTAAIVDPKSCFSSPFDSCAKPADGSFVFNEHTHTHTTHIVERRWSLMSHGSLSTALTLMDDGAQGWQRAAANVPDCGSCQRIRFFWEEVSVHIISPDCSAH